jgi:DNA-binding MarR family transcriptional regulator
VSQGKPDLAAELVTHAARLIRTVRRSAAAESPAALVRVLSILDELGPSTITALADADRISQPTMTTTVNEAAQRGWVTKRPNPVDARSSLVELTAAGSKVLAVQRHAYGELLAASLAPYTSADLESAVALLKHLTEEAR